MENFPNYPPSVQDAILNGPALTPPDGVVSDFDNPSNHNTEALVLAVVCISLALVAACLRAYSRLFVSKNLHLEDYIALAAFGFYGGFLWTYFSYYTICGFFVHQWDIQVKTLFKVSYVVIILPIVYGSVMLLMKPAILLEWTRIFVPHGRRNSFFWMARILMLANVLMYLSGIIATSLACIPLEKLWHKWLPGKCIDRKALDIFSATFNLVTDIIILLLPQKVIWKLQMTASKKFGISLVFSIGLLACACAAGRLYACITQSYGGSGDATYTLGRTFLWATAETTCVLSVFCIPAIPKAFKDSQKGFISRIARSVRSWARMASFGSLKNSVDNQSWLPYDQDSLQQDSIAPSTRGHRFGAEMKPGKTVSFENINIVQALSIQPGTDGPYGQIQYPVHGISILRTTEVLQQKENNPHGDADAHGEGPGLDQQHPWVHCRVNDWVEDHLALHVAMGVAPPPCARPTSGRQQGRQ